MGRFRGILSIVAASKVRDHVFDEAFHATKAWLRITFVSQFDAKRTTLSLQISKATTLRTRATLRDPTGRMRDVVCHRHAPRAIE